MPFGKVIFHAIVMHRFILIGDGMVDKLVIRLSGQTGNFQATGNHICKILLRCLLRNPQSIPAGSTGQGKQRIPGSPFVVRGDNDIYNAIVHSPQRVDVTPLTTGSRKGNNPGPLRTDIQCILTTCTGYGRQV